MQRRLQGQSSQLHNGNCWEDDYETSIFAFGRAGVPFLQFDCDGAAEARVLFLTFNGSSQEVRLEIRAGAMHTLTLHPHSNDQFIFRSSGSYADASFVCGGSRHNAGLHLQVKDPQIHFTIYQGCRISVRYLPEPKG